MLGHELELYLPDVELWVEGFGILLYNASLAYFGYATKHLTGLVQSQPPASFIPHSLLVVGLLVLIVILIYVAKKAGRILKALNVENADK